MSFSVAELIEKLMSLEDRAKGDVDVVILLPGDKAFVEIDEVGLSPKRDIILISTVTPIEVGKGKKL